MDLFNYKITAKNYSAKQFVFFRRVFGLYLLIHFAMLLPYSAEMFSAEGIYANPDLNFSYGHFPNVLNVFDSPAHIIFFISVLIAGSIFFFFGMRRRLVSIILWYGWTCLINRNNLIINPGMPYIGWILLASAFIPSEKNESWEMPKWCILGAWLIMGVGYTISGCDKLQSPSWTNGNTFSLLLENPLSRNTWLREMTLNFYPFILKLMTWAILFCELLFLPMALFSATRKYAWLLLTVLHLGILCYVNFADLTIGMLMIHLFTFDRSWFVKKVRKENEQFSFSLTNEELMLQLEKD